MHDIEGLQQHVKNAMTFECVWHSMRHHTKLCVEMGRQHFKHLVLWQLQNIWGMLYRLLSYNVLKFKRAAVLKCDRLRHMFIYWSLEKYFSFTLYRILKIKYAWHITCLKEKKISKNTPEFILLFNNIASDWRSSILTWSCPL